MSSTRSAQPGGPEAAGGVSVLDKALWSRLNEETDLGEFAKVWLALLVRQFGAIEAGAVVLDVGGGFAPVAVWPKREAPSHDLANAVENAIGRKQGVAIDRAIAHPIMVDGQAVGAVGLTLPDPSTDTAEALRNLKWHMGWLLSAVRRDMGRHEARDIARQSAVLDVVGAVLEAKSLRAAGLSAVTLLARKLDCAQVVLGFLKRDRIVIQALSDVAENRMNTSYTQSLAVAMAEATDQQGSVLYPPREGQTFMVNAHHKQLAAQRNSGDLLTVPLFDGDDVMGALHFEKAAGGTFDGTDIVIAEATAAALGPLLAEMQQAERPLWRVARDVVMAHLGRLLGPGHLGRKLALIALIAIGTAATLIQGSFRVVAEAELEGRVVRSLVAPFDGHVYEQYARAGDIVEAGAPLARLDERDLQLEYLRWTTDLSRYQGEYDRALADRDAAGARIARAEIDQSAAKAELIRRQLERAALLAPFDAVVIEGDLSQSLGVAVRRGEELFRIAPLDAYRVSLEVEERDLDQVQVGQTGQLVLSSLPDRSFPFEVTQITPRMQAADGRNFAVVEANLTQVGEEIRPGMRGIAKVEVDQRPLIEIWTRPIVDWFRLAIWRWTP